MLTKPDEFLIAQVAIGNKPAFQALTTRYIDQVRRVSYKVVRNAHDAEDVAQEVFATVWNERGNWRADSNAAFSTWLYRVAINRAIDHRRRHKVEHTVIDEDMFECDGKRADELLCNRQTQAMLMECLKQLPEKQMRALLYFYYEELEIDEIRQRLDTTEDSVRSLLKRGKISLKEAIAEHNAASHSRSHLSNSSANKPVDNFYTLPTS